MSTKFSANVRDPLELMKPELREVLKRVVHRYRDVVDYVSRCGISFVYSDTDSLAFSLRRLPERKEDAINLSTRLVEMINTVVQIIYGHQFVMDLDDELSDKLKKGEPPVYDMMIVARQKDSFEPSKKSYILVSGDKVTLKGIFFKLQAIDAIKDRKTELIMRAVKEGWSARKLEEECLRIIREAPTQKLFFVRSISVELRNEEGGYKQISRSEHYVMFTRLAQLFRDTRYVRHIKRDKCNEKMGELCGIIMVDANIEYEVPAVDVKYLIISSGRNRCSFYLLDSVLPSGDAICYECHALKPSRKRIGGKLVDLSIVDGWYRLHVTCKKVTIDREKLERVAWMNTRSFIETLDKILLTPISQVSIESRASLKSGFLYEESLR